jgi:hypothetical protein
VGYPDIIPASTWLFALAAGVQASHRREATSSAASDDILPPADEAIFLRRENRRKDTGPMVGFHDEQWSSVMLGQLFSLIYRLSCRATLIEIGVHRLAR